MSESTGVEWLPSVSVQDICELRSMLNEDVVRGLFCLHGSWNKDLEQAQALLRQWSPAVHPGRKFVAGMVQVDESDDSMEVFCGDNGCSLSMGCNNLPHELPALLAVVQDAFRTQSCVQVVKGVTPREILEGSPRLLNPIKATFNSLILGIATSVPDRKRRITPAPVQQKALRIFVAGDRANVGKTSVCLGLLGSLVSMGYEPADVAYIKPATQDESKQLLQIYCEKVGITCVPIGPVIFYKGFTRAFLADEAESSADMLDKVTGAVNELAAGKRVVVIDGVGYPAVGSICGVDNASVAKACRYSEQNQMGVLIVGPSGVGHAVDSFNLNASYFESKNVPVMGAIFNKLSMDGYYSLENCRAQVSSYFQKYQATSSPFGFVPLFPELGGDNSMDHLDDFFKMFAKHVDVNGILQSARRIQKSRASVDSAAPVKRAKVGHQQSAPNRPESFPRPQNGNLPRPQNGNLLSRHQIEEQASAAGAQTKC